MLGETLDKIDAVAKGLMEKDTLVEEEIRQFDWEGRRASSCRKRTDQNSCRMISQPVALIPNVSGKSFAIGFILSAGGENSLIKLFRQNKRTRMFLIAIPQLFLE